MTTLKEFLLNRVDLHERVSTRTIFVMGGLDAASFATVLSLVALDKLSRAQTISVYCFALAIPILTSVVLVSSKRLEIGRTNNATEMILGIMSILGTAPAVAGFVAVMFHFSPTVGWLAFVASTLAALLSITVGLIQRNACSNEQRSNPPKPK